MAQTTPLSESLPYCYEQKSLKAHNLRGGKREIRETFGPVWRLLVEIGFLGVRKVMR